MGTEPLVAEQPWALINAFGGHQGGRQLTPYQRARLQLAQQKLQQQGGSGSPINLDAQQDAQQDQQDYGYPSDVAIANLSSLPSMTQPRPNIPNVPGNVQPIIAQAAADNGVSLPLFTRLVKQESGFNQNATSPTGAHGLTQLMPGTAKQMGVDPNDAMQNAEGGAKYLHQQLQHYDGNEGRALAAYNWGPGNVDKWIARGADPSRAPAETQNYVKSITGRPLAMNDTPLPPPRPQYATPQQQTQVADNADDGDSTDPTTRLSWLV